MKFFLLILLVLYQIYSYHLIDNQRTLKLTLQRFSHKPAIVTYQMNQKYIQVQDQQFNQIQKSISDFAQLLVIDCNKNVKLSKNLSIPNCDNIARSTFPIMYLYGVKPMDYRISIRDKIFQLSPRVLEYRQDKRDTQLKIFAQNLLPDYLKKLYSQTDLNTFLKSGNLLLPKIICKSTNQQELLIIKKMGIYFFSRANFGEIIQSDQFNQIHKLSIYIYNFQQQKFQVKHYQKKINQKQYQQLKNFISQNVPQEKVPTLYHQLTLPEYKLHYANQKNISLVTYDYQLWNLIYQGTLEKGHQVLQKYKQKYGEYFTYILKVNPQQSKLYLSHNKQKLLNLDNAQISQQEVFQFDQIQNNAQRLLSFGNIVFLVEPKLDYLCSIENLKIFKNFIICIPIRIQDIPKVKKQFNVPDQDQLAILFRKTPENQFKGLNLKNKEFKTVIKQIYKVTYQRITMLANKFIKSPVLPLSSNVSYTRACGQLCLFYFHNRQKPNLYQFGQINQAALKYNQELGVIESDSRCNQQFLKLIKKNSQTNLILFSKGKYFNLKQKITLANIDKLMRVYKKGAIKWKQLGEQLRSNEQCKYVYKKKQANNQEQTSEQL